MEEETKKLMHVRLVRITEDGDGVYKGIGISPSGKMIFVENVSGDDDEIRVEIKQELEESILARKIGDSLPKKKESGEGKEPAKPKDPYSVEGDDEELEDEDLYDEDETERDEEEEDY